VLGFVLVAGRKYRGAVFLPGNVNPVEIIKPMLVLALAAILAGHRKLLARGFLGIPLPPINILVTVGILWAPPMALLILQGDMGMFALMNATLLVMLYSVTKRSGYLFCGIAAVFFLARLLIPLSTRGRARLEAWLDPFTAATGGGWQPLQALVALYSGGLLGTGLGAGSPNVVPIVESDFAYIIIGEELGLVGCIATTALYAALVLAGLRIAERAQDPFRSATATGLSACLGLQILLNIGGVVKAIPLTGIPLPLISHGGSSLATTFLMAGILLAIGDDRAPPRPAPKPEEKPKSRPAPKPRHRPSRTPATGQV
jgi:cell division protein FtsW (lipid II flippase)